MKQQLCKSKDWNRISYVYDKLRKMPLLVGKNIGITVYTENNNVMFRLEI